MTHTAPRREEYLHKSLISVSSNESEQKLKVVAVS